MTQEAIGRQLRSTVKKEGILELSLARVPTPEPKPDEVVVRIDATPINPSDLGLMLAGADMSAAKVSGSLEDPVVTAPIPPAALRSVAGRNRPVAARRKRGRRRGRARGVLRRSARARRKDGRDPRRRDVRAVPDDHKQVYIYGGLDRGPMELTRNFGMAWGIGGWLLTTFLQKIGPAAAQKLRERVAAEIKTTFASRYDKEVSLAEALRLEEIAVYGKQATGQKYLINPNKGLGR